MSEFDIILGVIATLTSIVSAIFGLGGGVLLISVLPDFLPGAAVIPVHSFTQFFSNFSRVCFSFKSVKWSLLPEFLIGSLVGAILFGFFLSQIPGQYLPLTIGIYLLLNMWVRRFSDLFARLESMFLLGLIKTGMGLFVGATGPLSAAILYKKLQQKESIVATNAALMGISHIFKLLLFGFLGFQFQKYIYTMIFMISGAVLGSFIGTKLRQYIGNRNFEIFLKILITVLAIKMVIQSIF